MGLPGAQTTSSISEVPVAAVPGHLLQCKLSGLIQEILDVF